VRGILPHTQASQFGTCKHDMIMVRLGKTGRCFIRSGELDRKPQNGGGQKRDLDNALAAPFYFSQYRGMPMGDEALFMRRNTDAVVAHESCEIARFFRGRD
jgi:hypothetical protein